MYSKEYKINKVQKVVEQLDYVGDRQGAEERIRRRRHLLVGEHDQSEAVARESDDTDERIENHPGYKLGRLKERIEWVLICRAASVFRVGTGIVYSVEISRGNVHRSRHCRPRRCVVRVC